MLVAQREQEQLGLPGSLVAVSECPVLARLDSVPMRLVALEPVAVASVAVSVAVASVAVSVAVASVAVSAVWAAVVGESRCPAPEQRECPRLIRLV